MTTLYVWLYFFAYLFVGFIWASLIARYSKNSNHSGFCKELFILAVLFWPLYSMAFLGEYWVEFITRDKSDHK